MGGKVIEGEKRGKQIDIEDKEKERKREERKKEKEMGKTQEESRREGIEIWLKYVGIWEGGTLPFFYFSKEKKKEYFSKYA